MNPTVNNFALIHDDLVGTLYNEAWANQVSVFKIVDKRIDSQVKQAALGGRNGGCGSTIEVLSPQLIEPEPNSGRLLKFKLAFMVKDWDTLAQGSNGTKLTGEQVCQNILQTFWGLNLIGVSGGIYPDPEAFTPVMHADASYRLFAVKMRALCDLGTYPKVSVPSWSDGALSDGNRTITLTDTQPGGGSTIYYTTDGSLPCPGNPPTGSPPYTAQDYAAPIAVPVGKFLRFKAYNPTPVNGLVPLASDVQGLTVS